MQLQWDLLYKDVGAFPRLLQFAEFGDDRFRYGINDLLQHCLYFHFPDNSNNKIVEPVRMTNIFLEESMVEGKPTLILTLVNENSKNLFSDLIISIVSQARPIDSQNIKKGFIALCNEWFELFDPLRVQLARNELQGIFAELYFLKYLIIESKFSLNDILQSWKGPFGKGHDFELVENHFEIKSITENKPVITISSEFQLDFLSGQQLFLVVYEFSNQPSTPTTLGDLVFEIINILNSETGVDTSLFIIALAKAGVPRASLDQYDIYKFAIKSAYFYNTTYGNFPSIKRSGLPDSIRSVKYDLALNTISDYLVDEIKSFI